MLEATFTVHLSFKHMLLHKRLSEHQTNKICKWALFFRQFVSLVLHYLIPECQNLGGVMESSPSVMPEFGGEMTLETRSQSSNFWKTDSRTRTKGRDLRRKGIGCEVIGFGFDNDTRDETVKPLLLKNIRWTWDGVSTSSTWSSLFHHSHHTVLIGGGLGVNCVFVVKTKQLK